MDHVASESILPTGLPDIAVSHPPRFAGRLPRGKAGRCRANAIRRSGPARHTRTFPSIEGLVPTQQGGTRLTDHIGERACQLAVYMIENRATVRAAAKKFGISKSTVHKDLSQRLPQYNQALYEQVKVILDTNKAQRHIRGGLATRKKYKGE